MKQVTDGIAMLDLSTDMGGYQVEIHPTLIWDDKDAVLVDAGLSGMMPTIRYEMEAAGVPLERLTWIVLTNQDVDHMAGAEELLAAVGHRVLVIAHVKDTPYIEGEKPLMKHNASRGPVPKVRVDIMVNHADVLPVAGGLTVIYTPGHTPGHMSIYHRNTKTLIVADASECRNGKLTGPNKECTPDMAEALRSLTNLATYDVKRAVCYHGGLCDRNVNEQIRKLAGQAYGVANSRCGCNFTDPRTGHSTAARPLSLLIGRWGHTVPTLPSRPQQRRRVDCEANHLGSDVDV